MTPTFTELLHRVGRGFPTRSALAKAIGVSGSHLSRAMNAGDFPFNTANCLRLARVADESPSAILRLAGKGDVADLIESLYGRDRAALLSADEREVLRLWTTLTPSQRRSWLTLLKNGQP